MEFEKLRKIIVEVLNVDESEVTPEATFVDDLGADSLDVFQIIMGLEEEFDIEIPNEEAEKIVNNFEKPAGYEFEMDGENEATTEAMGQVLLMMALGVLLMYGKEQKVATVGM